MLTKSHAIRIALIGGTDDAGAHPGDTVEAVVVGFFVGFPESCVFLI
jgi:hypothetical protein